MAEITELNIKPIEEDANAAAIENVKRLGAELNGVLGTDESEDVSAALTRMLALPDEDFDILAPGVLQSYQQSLNNANDKLLLVQTLNALGMKADDLTDAFAEIAEAIDKTNFSVTKRDFLKEFVSSMINSINETEGIAKRIISIPIEFCHEDAKMPAYAHISDSGLDIYAIEDITVHPGQTVLMPTGLKVALPVGYELQVRPKSGRALKTKLRVANTPGTIDQGYRDEIKVIIENVEAPIKDLTSEFDEETGTYKITSILYGSDYTISKGEKFAQLVLAETPKASFYRVNSVKDFGEDRGGGFGSTGTN